MSCPKAAGVIDGAVADGVFWIVVNLKDQGVGAGGDGGPGHRDESFDLPVPCDGSTTTGK